MSNTVIGFLNILTLISSIVLLGSALWMGRSKTTCEHFLQKPLLILGLAILILSVAGLVGACCDVAWVLWVYLFFMVFIIVALMGLTLFGFIVTSHSGGVVVDGRVYKEFKLEAYHPWLKTRVVDTNYWVTIKTCLLGSVTCSKLALWTPLDYLQKDLSPLQLFTVLAVARLKTPNALNITASLMDVTACPNPDLDGNSPGLFSFLMQQLFLLFSRHVGQGGGMGEIGISEKYLC
ncbi:hypothetical protein [Arabidopsis thaliana]